MSNYKGLFTFDVDSHKYVAVGEAGGLITNFDYKPSEPRIDNEEIREIIRAWAKINDASVLTYDADENSLRDIFRNEIHFNRALGLKDGGSYSVNELCGK